MCHLGVGKMTSPDIMMPRSWVLETAAGSWQWMNVVAGKNGGAANMVGMPAGVWTVMATSYATLPIEIRYVEGTSDPKVVAVIPAATADTSAMASVQIPMKISGTVHLRVQGQAPLTPARAALVAVPIELAS